MSMYGKLKAAQKMFLSTWRYDPSWRRNIVVLISVTIKWWVLSWQTKRRKQQILYIRDAEVWSETATDKFWLYICLKKEES